MKPIQFSLLKLLVWCPFVASCLGYAWRIVSALPKEFVAGFQNIVFFANKPGDLDDGGYFAGCAIGWACVVVGLVVLFFVLDSICCAIQRKE